MDFGVFASQSSRLKVVLEECQPRLGSVAKDVPSTVKVCIVKCQQVLVLVIQTLYSVCLALRKVPDIAKSKLSGLMTAVLIYGRHKDSSEKYLAPFSL
jgi:hypothetical protein